MYQMSKKILIPNVVLISKNLNWKKFEKSTCYGVLTEFCDRSSFHGVSYFTDGKRHWIERVFWMIAFSVSVLLCVTSISSTWSTWQANPVVVTNDNRPTSVGEIPFPAISICPMIKTSAKKFNFTDVYRNILKIDGSRSRNVTEKELKLMQVVSQVCDDQVMFDMFDFFSDSNSNHSDSSTMSVLNELAPKFEETFVFCKLFEKWSKCHDIFYPVMTDEGNCYVFNAFNIKEIVTSDDTATDYLDGASMGQPPSDWLMEGGYNRSLTREAYPYRVFSSGKHASFQVLLWMFNEDIDPLCSAAIHGFKVTFHPPNETPQITKKYFHVSPGKLALFTINPQLIMGIPNSRKYSPNVRQCYFNTEKKLRFFIEYTQHNCELECTANFTLASCGCVKFSMPRSKGTKICGVGKFLCSSQADDSVYRSGAFDKCRCLPDCTSVSYSAQSSEADYDLVSFYSQSRLQPEFNFENSTFSSLVVSFKEDVFIPSKRAEYRSVIDFLANAGGLLGLFLGVSLLSIVEMIYYFKIRIFFTKRAQEENKQRDNTAVPVTMVPNPNTPYQVIGHQLVHNQTRIYNFLP